MSQKSTKFDEFTSLFRATVRPHLEVEPLPLKRLLVVVDVNSDEEKYDAICKVAECMAGQFKPSLKLFAPVSLTEQLNEAQTRLNAISERIRSKGGEVATEARRCFPAQAILAELESFEADFVVIPTLFGELDRELEGFTLGAVVDKVLSCTELPTLLIEGGVENAESLFDDILLFVEEIETAQPCLAVTRTLASKAAEARLLHVIDKHMLRTVERAIDIATELETEVATQALVTALRKDMEHFLQSAKDLLDRTGHRASTSIEIGDPVETTRAFIRENGPNLVICSSVAPDERLVDSVAYNLAAYLREVPLLLV